VWYYARCESAYAPVLFECAALVRGRNQTARDLVEASFVHASMSGREQNHPIQQAKQRKPMTRNGKIARLPADIRTELNQRILDGEQAQPLVEWLNGLPKVQAVLKAKFDGHAITENNLSQWRNGGYAAWEAGERMADHVKSIMDGTTALKAAAKEALTDRMALMLAANIAIALQGLESMPDGIEKVKVWRELRIGILALRRSEFCAELLKIERLKHPDPQKKKKEPKMTPEQKKERFRRILGIGPGYDGSKNPELTKPPWLRTDAQYKPVQVSTSESNQ
jgi:hypothetical protein